MALPWETSTSVFVQCECHNAIEAMSPAWRQRDWCRVGQGGMTLIGGLPRMDCGYCGTSWPIVKTSYFWW
jgi:hypothetical protein